MAGRATSSLGEIVVRGARKEKRKRKEKLNGTVQKAVRQTVRLLLQKPTVRMLYRMYDSL